MPVCVYVSSNSSETVEVIIIKPGTVTASDMRMHQMLIILTLTFIQGHTDLNHENNKCSTILEIVQAMPIKFTVKIVRNNNCKSGDLDLHSRSPLHLKLEIVSTCILFLIVIYDIRHFKLWHSNLA